MFDYVCDEEVLKLFWSHVDIKKENECWNWKAGKDKDGYGKFSIKISKNLRKHLRSHRLSYFLAYGRFDEKLLICHSCDNPSCVNPKHLFLGTAKDNIVDAVNKGRITGPKGYYGKKGEENNSAKLTEEDVLEIRRLFNDPNNTIKYLSEKFNIHPSTIYYVARGRSWKHVEGYSTRASVRHEINLSIANEIRKTFCTGKYNKKEISLIFGVDPSTVSRIISNENYKI